MRAERVTQQRAAHEQLLYFTSPSLFDEDRRLVFISDRTGHPNLFVRDLDSDNERQLTRNADGYLKSYVYFDGAAYRGFGKASVTLDPETGTLYYIHGREIRRIDSDGGERTLAQYPDGQMTAFTHVSSDGKRLCVPTTDARALDGSRPLRGKLEYDIDERVRTERLASWLRVFDTDTGEETVRERVEGCWITHVQFRPGDSGQILYNHEWPSDCGIRRMWLFDGVAHRRLRTEGDGRSRGDWTCHEMWERDGSAIVYHGGYEDGRMYIGRVDPDEGARREIPLPARYTRYGHFTVGSPGALVTDGYHEAEGDAESWGGAWISQVDVDWDAGATRWTPLCRSGSSWATQDEHPHPVFDHAMRHVWFTSDVDGRRAVYRVPTRIPNHERSTTTRGRASRAHPFWRRARIGSTRAARWAG